MSRTTQCVRRTRTGQAAAVALTLPLLAGLVACGGTATTTGTTTPTTGAVTATSTATSSPTATATTSASPPATSPSDTSSTGSTSTGSGTTSATGTSGSTALGDNFQALGTEPFWSVAVTGTGMLYTQVDQPNRSLTGTRSGDGDEITMTGSKEGVEYRLEVKRASCSDGMSETHYDWSAEFHYGEVELKGCAKPVG